VPYGLYLTVTHTGTTAAALLLNDIFPTTDGTTTYRRAGPVYVPVNGTITLTFTDTVATSFENGAIRGFVNLGYLTATLFFGTGVQFPPATGDVSGTYPNLTVVGIQGFPIQDGGGPNNGDALIYNSVTQLWEHSPIVFGGGPPVGPAGGDLSGLYPNPTIALLAVTDAKVAVANKDGVAGTPSMRTLGVGATQACAGNDARLSDARTPTGAAGGDLGGLYPNPSVTGLQANPVDNAAPNANDALVCDGAQWTPTPVGSALQAVWGQFSDSTDQTFAGGTFTVKFDTTEDSNGVSVVNDPITLRPTRITVAQAGVYAINISPQLLHTGGGTETVIFWANLDGVTIPRSASSLEMGNNNNRTLPFVELVLSMNAGQYIEWVFTASLGTNLTLEAYPVNGVTPAIPSVIVNVKRIGS
jgi:hypothetical protein